MVRLGTWKMNSALEVAQISKRIEGARLGTGYIAVKREKKYIKAAINGGRGLLTAYFYKNYPNPKKFLAIISI